MLILSILPFIILITAKVGPTLDLLVPLTRVLQCTLDDLLQVHH